MADIERYKLQEETNCLQWNQSLAEKETQILELQDKLDGILQPRMNSARSRDELEAISESESGGLLAITKALTKISNILTVSTYFRSVITSPKLTRTGALKIGQIFRIAPIVRMSPVRISRMPFKNWRPCQVS